MEPKKLSPAEGLIAQFNDLREEFAKVLPKHVTIEKFERTFRTLAHTSSDMTNPEMDKASIFAECLKCATDGLIPDGKEATIVPRNINVGTKESPQWKKVARYSPMVAGICKRARNSGEVKRVEAYVVHENESPKFKYWIDEKGPHLYFEPLFVNLGKAVLTIACCELKDGALFTEMINEEQMAAIKSKAGKGSAWYGPFDDEMRKKSTLHRLLKYRVPSSADDVDDDDGLYTPEGQAVPTSVASAPAKPTTPSTQPTKLENALGVPSGAPSAAPEKVKETPL